MCHQFWGTFLVKYLNNPTNLPGRHCCWNLGQIQVNASMHTLFQGGLVHILCTDMNLKIVLTIFSGFLLVILLQLISISKPSSRLNIMRDEVCIRIKKPFYFDREICTFSLGKRQLFQTLYMSRTLMQRCAELSRLKNSPKHKVSSYFERKKNPLQICNCNGLILPARQLAFYTPHELYQAWLQFKM